MLITIKNVNETISQRSAKPRVQACIADELLFKRSLTGSEIIGTFTTKNKSEKAAKMTLLKVSEIANSEPEKWCDLLHNF